MPGPNRINRAAQDRKDAMNARQIYYVIDPHCEKIGEIEVTDHIRSNGVSLTATEAMAFIAGGAITADKAVADHVRADLEKKHGAMREREEQARLAQEQKDREQQQSQAHNLGLAAQEGDTGPTASGGEQSGDTGEAAGASGATGAEVVPDSVSHAPSQETQVRNDDTGTWASNQHGG